MEYKERTKGITLIALVVTIVVLLILAGITINYVMGDNSVFKKATEAKLQTDIAKSKEKLELTFGHAKLLKHTDKGYNQDDYLDELMTKEIHDIEIKGDIVIVDGYVFEIDRNEPKIGQYVGKQSELVFPEITVNVTLAEDAKTATIHITAKEDKNGISKIEIIQGGYVLETYECENTKEEVVKDYTAKQNGTYTIKVYAGLTVSEKAKVEGLIANVEYSPNGNEEYKKEHQVKVSVKETKEKVKSIKYQWLATTVEPEADTFTETCSNNGTITGKGYTGTYYLWTLLETESGKTNICRSEGFNFDNTGPIITKFTYNPTSETSYNLSCQASDNESKMDKYEIYVNGKCIDSVSSDETEYTTTDFEEVMDSSTDYEVRAFDTLGNYSVSKLTNKNNIQIWKKSELIEEIICERTQIISARDYAGGFTTYNWSYTSDVIAVGNGFAMKYPGTGNGWDALTKGGTIWYISGTTLEKSYNYRYQSEGKNYIHTSVSYRLSKKTNYKKGEFICFENYTVQGTHPTNGNYNGYYYELN